MKPRFCQGHLTASQRARRSPLRSSTKINGPRTTTRSRTNSGPDTRTSPTGRSTASATIEAAGEARRAKRPRESPPERSPSSGSGANSTRASADSWRRWAAPKSHSKAGRTRRSNPFSAADTSIIPTLENLIEELRREGRFLRGEHPRRRRRRARRSGRTRIRSP